LCSLQLQQKGIEKMKKMTIRLEPDDFEKLRTRAFQARLPVGVFVRQELTGHGQKPAQNGSSSFRVELDLKNTMQ
jgi:hypothetical protein